MQCPACEHPHSQIRDTRPKPKATYRRRECNECGYRWTTYETVIKPGILARTLDRMIDEMIFKLKGIR